jgi:type IV secretory pathway VirB2 component (pilin)
MKKLKYILLIMVLMFCVPKQTKAFDMTGILPGTLVMGSSKIEWRICKIRRLFCGKVAVLVVSVSIFTIGFLMVIGKLSWPVSLLMIFGCLVFYYAPLIANGMQHASGRAIAIFNPICDCRCALSLDQDDVEQIMFAFIGVGEKDYLKNKLNPDNLQHCIPKYGGLPGAFNFFD